MPGRGPYASRLVRPHSSSQRCGDYVSFIATEESCQWRGNSVNSSTGWRRAQQHLCPAWKPISPGRGDLLAEAYRLQGVLLLGQVIPDAVQAEACFQQALAVARRQQAKSWELRAATSLARLWQQQGKRSEARTLLAPIYGWCTEGFDTADLQDAQALLEQLQG